MLAGSARCGTLSMARSRGRRGECYRSRGMCASSGARGIELTHRRPIDVQLLMLVQATSFKT